MKKYLSENEYFESTDLNLVTALCCFGAQIETINKRDRDKSIFLIPHEKGLDALVQAYWGHSLKVDPLLFANYLKENKTRLYQKTE